MRLISEEKKKRHRDYPIKSHSSRLSELWSSISPRRSRLSHTLEGEIDEPYQSIDSACEIRLLTLLPPAEDAPDEVICRLTRQRESKDLYYYAISYTWGRNERGDRERIQCNGANMWVTRNCLHVLQLLARLRLFGPIWIDALCINQDDIEERNQQVVKMREIFRNAERTLVYLNEADENPVLRRMGTLQEEWMDGLNGEPQFHNPNLLHDYSDFARRNILRANAFYSSPWFTRTWIIQEVLSSRCLSFLVESSNRPVPFEVATQLYEYWKETQYKDDIPDVIRLRQQQDELSTNQELLHELPPGAMPLHIQSVSHVDDPHAAVRAPSIPIDARLLSYDKLFEMLETTQHFKCKDPRDKLFAILALFDRPLPLLLEPDYAKSVIEVFADLTYFLLGTNRPEILSLASQDSSDTSKPSWVVDWSDATPQPERLESNPFFQGTLSAGKWTSHSSPIFVKRLSIDTILLRGRLVGPVEWFKGDAGGKRWYVQSSGWYRKFSTRRSGVVCEGDQACVFLGFECSFIVRRIAQVLRPRAYQIVDQCYIDDVMESQALASVNASDAYAQRPPNGLMDFEIY